MENRFWLINGILILVILFAVIWFAISKKTRIPPNYHSFFVLGIVMLIFGIIQRNIAFLGAGAVFSVIGFANKNKWEENKESWSQLSSGEKAVLSLVMLGIAVLVLIIFFSWISNKGG
jgi:uncharacterized membrane protein